MRREPGRPSGRTGQRAGAVGRNVLTVIDALINDAGYGLSSVSVSFPGLSDALASYAFGAFGVPLWQMAVGAFIGSVPRAFVYTALGASIGNRSPCVGVRGDGGVVPDRHCGRVRCASGLSALARAWQQ